MPRDRVGLVAVGAPQRGVVVVIPHLTKRQRTDASLRGEWWLGTSGGLEGVAMEFPS